MRHFRFLASLRIDKNDNSRDRFGVKNTKTIIIKDGKIFGKGKVLSGFDRQKAAEQSLAIALKDAAMSKGDIQKIYGTGEGDLEDLF
ncbi:MAG: hypothetical protein P8X68_20420 [Desulfobacterales bacterium]